MAKTWNLLRQKVPGGKVLSHIYIDNTEPGQSSYMAGELLMTENDWLNFSGMLRKAATDNLDLSVQVVAADIKSIKAEVDELKREDAKKLLDALGRLEELEAGLEAGLVDKQEEIEKEAQLPHPGPDGDPLPPAPHSTPPVAPMKFYPAPKPSEGQVIMTKKPGDANDPKTK